MSLQIWVIDDYSVNNFITTRMLKKHGPDCYITPFVYAHEAVEYLCECREKDGFPDVIFLDISMPGMDGWQFLDQLDLLKLDPQFNIKIYFLSSTLNHREHALALAHKRISGFYSKPLTAESIYSIFGGVTIAEHKA